MAAEPAHTAPICAGTDVSRLVADLAGPRTAIEEAFTGVGDRLARSAMLLDRIVAAFAALPRDLGSPQMAEATERLDIFARRTREIADAFAEERNGVERLAVAVAAATHPIDDLRRAIKMMAILAVNARIVAAGINSADRFDVFTSDIAELSDSAGKAVAAFAAGHDQLNSAVEAAAGQFAGFDAAHRSVLSELAAALEQSLGELAQRRAASIERSSETTRVSQAIAGRIGSAVMALQVGDSTRQRVQHSEEALERAAAWLAGETVAGLALPPASASAVLSQVLALQDAQLRATLEAFAGDTADAEQALQQLARDAAGAIEDSRRLYGGAGDRGSTLAILGQQMRRAAALLRDCAAERSRLGQMAALVDRTVEVLLGHVDAVQEIEANMRLVGLNAAVKCAQIGPLGASLSVIAAQLRELTGELVPAARSAIARLEEAMAAAKAFSAAANGRLAQEIEQLETDAMAAIGLVEGVDARLTEALNVLDRDGPQATALLVEAGSGLGNHVAIAESLADAHLRLNEVAAGHEVATGTVHDEAVAAALQSLRRLYSMEEERRIHDRIVGAPPAEAAPASTAGDDALELF